jgi:hypothetical protein
MKRSLLIGIGVIVITGIIGFGAIFWIHFARTPGRDAVAGRLAADPSFIASYGSGATIALGHFTAGYSSGPIGGNLTGSYMLRMRTPKGDISVRAEWEVDPDCSFRLTRWSSPSAP